MLSQGFLATVRAVDNPAVRLIKAFGSKAETAKRFKVSREAIRLWLKDRIPPDRALDVEQETAGSEHAVSALEVLRYAKWREDTAAVAAGVPTPAAA